MESAQQKYLIVVMAERFEQFRKKQKIQILNTQAHKLKCIDILKNDMNKKHNYGYQTIYLFILIVILIYLTNIFTVD